MTATGTRRGGGREGDAERFGLHNDQTAQEIALGAPFRLKFLFRHSPDVSNKNSGFGLDCTTHRFETIASERMLLFELIAGGLIERGEIGSHLGVRIEVLIPKHIGTALSETVTGSTQVIESARGVGEALRCFDTETRRLIEGVPPSPTTGAGEADEEEFVDARLDEREHAVEAGGGGPFRLGQWDESFWRHLNIPEVIRCRLPRVFHYRIFRRSLHDASCDAARRVGECATLAGSAGWWGSGTVGGAHGYSMFGALQARAKWQARSGVGRKYCGGACGVVRDAASNFEGSASEGATVRWDGETGASLRARL